MQNEVRCEAGKQQIDWRWARRKRFVTGVNYTHNETPTGSSIAANNAQQRQRQRRDCSDGAARQST